MKALFFILISVCAAKLSISQVQKIKINDLEKIIKESKTPLLVNFWSTWCPPCKEEIPNLLQQVRLHKKDSVKLLLVSLDLESTYAKILPFAEKYKITEEILWLNETDADYFCPKIDPKWSGAFPASLFINNKSGYRKFIEDPLSSIKIEKEIKSLLGTSK